MQVKRSFSSVNYCSHSVSAATQCQQQTAGKMTSLASVRDSESERRFRVVVYGIGESPPNIPRYMRSQHDLDKICGAIPVIDPTSIKDFLGLVSLGWGKSALDQS